MSQDAGIALGLLLGGAGYLAMAWYVARRRHASAAGALLAVLFSIFVWTTCYAVELTTRSVAAAQPWHNLKYIGVVSLAPTLLVFVVEYTGNGRRLRRRTLWLLSIEPAAILALLWNPATHDLVVRYTHADVAAAQLPRWPIPESGPLFWPFVVYNYGLLLTALWLLVSRLIRIADPYRRSAWVVIVAALLPSLGNLEYNLLYKTYPLDPTPFLFALLAVVLVWGLFRLRLLDLVPVARGMVLEQMTDAVLVLDAANRVVDANPAAAALLGVLRPDLVGRDVRELAPAVTDLVDQHRAGGVSLREVAIGRGDLPGGRSEPVQLALQLTSLCDRRGAESGRLLVLRDVTERTRTEHKLRELLDAEQHLAAVLQTSLRPARLPQVHGLHLAARSVPAGQGSAVSGDFYDVHQALGGDWAFVLGDVAGKGVHAAVVTSMARYTVRTLSAQGWAPRQVIEQLNQALLVDSEPERFCTVVYGRISRLGPETVVRQPEPDGAASSSPAPPGRGMRVTVALGGHPAPFVRRLDGTVEPVGDLGTALGIVSVVRVSEVTVDLLPGEVLLAFTDGVTEARRDGAEFGEDRLMQTLSTAAAGLLGRSGPATAALVADAIADRVVGAVRDFTTNRDDVAVLVLVAD